MIIKNHNRIEIYDGGESLEKLPAKVFLLNFDDNNGRFFLSENEDFTLPEKIYGDIEKNTKRFLTTFNDRKGNLGILLEGLKGTGKSLQAKHLCKNAGLPVILFTADWHGPALEKFLARIKQSAILFFDEFEKIYKWDEEIDEGKQHHLLPLIDGVFESKHIFLFTTNNNQIHSAFINRPGRIYYKLNYSGLPMNIIEEVAKENLKNQNYLNDLLTTCKTIGELGMDILLSIIEESNRFNELPSETIEFMNIDNLNGDLKVVWTNPDHPGVTFNGYTKANTLKNSGVVYLSDTVYLSETTNQVKGFGISKESNNSSSREVYDEFRIYTDRQKPQYCKKEQAFYIEDKKRGKVYFYPHLLDA